MPSQATSAWYLEQVNRAIDHIVAHLDQPQRLEDVARVTAISPYHFHRVFQSLVGETPGDFSRRLRLEKAIKLMAFARRRSLTEIAFACGFQSSSDFSRTFKKHFGTSPRAFDIQGWMSRHERQLAENLESGLFHIRDLPAMELPDAFAVKIRTIPGRDVAYIRVLRPYEGDHVMRATEELMAWAEYHGYADSQWLGYQWDIPGITGLENCQYYVAVVADSFTPSGSIGHFRFPEMTVAEIELRGGIELELRALHWLYGSWLPRSRYVPADHPGFEAWMGRPFAHGLEYFELQLHVPIRRAPDR